MVAFDATRWAGRTGRMLAAAALWLAVFGAWAAEPTPVHLLRLSPQRPPCAGPQPGLPVIPNDPAALTGPSGERRCYGTQPPQLELRLPEGRFVWLQRQAPNPAAWIAVGPVLVDPAAVEPPPLGLRLVETDDRLSLETRYADTGTLTPLEPGRWQAIRSPDGSQFWVQVERTQRASG